MEDNYLITIDDLVDFDHIKILEKITHNFTRGIQYNKIKSEIIIRIADSMHYNDDGELNEMPKYVEETLFLINWVNDNM